MPGLAGEVANLIVSLTLDDSGFSGKLNRAAGQLKVLEAGGYRVGTGLKQVSGGLLRLGERAAVGAAVGLGAVVKTAIDFEDAFAGVRKTVDASDAQLNELQDTFREMARTIPLSFEELAGIGEQAGALGIARADIEEFTRVAALIGVTTDVSSDQAATALGQLSNVLNLTADDFDNFGATLVDLGNKGASTESQILELASRAGAGAHLIGIANDQTLGWASAVANLGIEVEAGGTALQKFFLESLRNLQDDDTLTIMAETAGMTGAAFKKAFEQDASGALVKFLDGLGDLSQAEQLAVLSGLGFTDQRITRALLGLAGNTDNLTTSLTTANEAWKDNSALQVEAEKRFKTTRSQMTLLKNNVRDVAYTIGAELLPVTNELITDFVGELNKPGTQAGIRAFAKDLATGVRGLVGELKGTDFSGIIGGMKIAAQVAKGAFDAFRSLPEPIQQLAIAALVANKVSGGAVGQIAKGLGNILLGGGQIGAGLFSRGSLANPMFVTVTNPGLGGGPGGVATLAGAKSFFPKGLTGWLGFLGIAAADFILISEAVNQFNQQKSNVTAAADFERGVVAGRTRSASTSIAGLTRLRNDIAGNIDTGQGRGNIIDTTLGHFFVDPELQRQVDELDQRIRAQTLAIVREDRDMTRHIDAGADGTRKEMHDLRAVEEAQRRLQARMRSEAQSADAVLISTSRVQTGLQREQRQQAALTVQRITEQRAVLNEQRLSLGIIARKDFSPTVNVQATINVSTSALTQQIQRARIATGNNFREGLA